MSEDQNEREDELAFCSAVGIAVSTVCVCLTPSHPHWLRSSLFLLSPLAL